MLDLFAVFGGMYAIRHYYFFAQTGDLLKNALTEVFISVCLKAAQKRRTSKALFAINSGVRSRAQDQNHSNDFLLSTEPW